MLSFNRINPNRSIPTSLLMILMQRKTFVSIVSIQTDQSRQGITTYSVFMQTAVSIVSIQTDQSRPFSPQRREICKKGFNRINPNRSIPTRFVKDSTIIIDRFQSYQSKQINPDLIKTKQSTIVLKQVSIVSIQTDQSRLRQCDTWERINADVSIVSIQTDQSRRLHRKTSKNYRRDVSIVSIQTDQSRLWGAYAAPCNITVFQSYQSKQINPDAG